MRVLVYIYTGFINSYTDINVLGILLELYKELYTELYRWVPLKPDFLGA